MRKVLIEFTRPANSSLAVFSWLIRKVQNTPYSHVRLRWINTTGRDVIYEASRTEVHFIGELAQPNHKVDILGVFSVELTGEQYRELVDLCMRYAGTKYGIKQILGIALVSLLRLKKNPFSDGTRSQVCSELVGRFLEEVVGLQLKVNLDVAGPKEINCILSNAAEKKMLGIKKVI